MRPPEVLFTADRFRVERVERTLPDGQTHRRDIVRHPGAVVILPLLADDTVVFIRNFRVAVGRTLLELPAGTLETGEVPLAAAGRELIEETGYAADRIEPLTAFYMSPGILDERMHAFLARDLRPGPQRLAAGEEIAVVLLPLAEALRAAQRGEIEDAKSLAVLLYYAARPREAQETPRGGPG